MEKNQPKMKEIVVSPKAAVAKLNVFFNHSVLPGKAGTKVKP